MERLNGKNNFFFLKFTLYILSTTISIRLILPKHNFSLFSFFPIYNSYKTNISNVYLVTIVPKNWLQSTCTCLRFFKQYKCKHVLAVGIITELVTPPDDSNTAVLHVKPKKGRPTQAKKALLMQ